MRRDGPLQIEPAMANEASCHEGDKANRAAGGQAHHTTEVRLDEDGDRYYEGLDRHQKALAWEVRRPEDDNECNQVDREGHDPKKWRRGDIGR